MLYIYIVYNIDSVYNIFIAYKDVNPESKWKSPFNFKLNPQVSTRLLWIEGFPKSTAIESEPGDVGYPKIT